MMIRPTGRRVVFALALGLLTAPGAALADFSVTGSFGPSGDVGFPNSPSGLVITFGASGQGTISQLDGFLNVEGQDLSNIPSGFGTAAQLGFGTPAGIGYTFSASQPNAHQLLLTYRFTNQSGGSLPGFQFLAFLDADIGPDFTDEYVGLTGEPSAGLPSLSPTSYQAGDPTGSNLFTNVLFGTLSNTNEAPVSSPGDVSIALGFQVGLIGREAIGEFQILLSDNGTTVSNPGLVLTQSDPIHTNDTLTVSARISLVPVPEPTGAALMTLGLGAGLGFRLRRHLTSRRRRP